MPSRLTVVLMSELLATPVVIFCLWLVIVPARGSTLCPEECQCDTVRYKVSCHGPSITTVPLIRVSDVRQLQLYANNIPSIEKDSFVSLTELELLSVLNCGLRTIELGALNGLTELTGLDVVGNEISEITPGTFENLINLKSLDLSYNELQHLDIDVFSGLVNLKNIYLVRNKLQYLHPDTFLGLPNIKHISLRYNPNIQIPTDRPFINSHSLSHLDISRCNVSSLTVETFTNVSALEWLDLSYNNLINVDINILTALPKLTTLYLYGNPLQCDCQLQWVWPLCEDRNITTGYREEVPKCDTPIEMKGMWWGVLEKGQCLKRNTKYGGDYKNIRYSYTDTLDSISYEHKPNFLTEYQVSAYAVTLIFGTTVNVILLIIIICNKDMRNVPNMYILNIAINDIIYLMALSSEAWENRMSDSWVKDEFLCTFILFSRRLSLGLSAYFLAVHRYRVTWKPLQVRASSIQAWRFTLATFCGVWIVAAFYALPAALYFSCDFYGSKVVRYDAKKVMFELRVFCKLPTCVFALIYLTTACHFVETYNIICEGRQNPLLNARRSIENTVVGYIVMFLISYVPYHALWMYIIYTKNVYVYYGMVTDIATLSDNNLRHMYLISTCSLLVRSCLSPVALFCTSSPFRQHLKRYLTCFCKTNSTHADIELGRRN